MRSAIPLNSLTIHLQLMERKLRRLPEDIRDDLQDSLRVAREEITRLDYIVTQFLRAIRPAPLETTIEDLNSLVQESLAFLAPELKDRDILVETELREGLPPFPSTATRSSRPSTTSSKMPPRR